jgi:hypothetical protein
MKISEGIKSGDITCAACGQDLEWRIYIKGDGETATMQLIPHACTKGDLEIKLSTVRTQINMAQTMRDEWGRVFGFEDKLYTLLNILCRRLCMVEQEVMDRYRREGRYAKV